MTKKICNSFIEDNERRKMARGGRVTAPLTYDPGRGRPKEHLAYLNKEEMAALRRINGGNQEAGPQGLPSFPPSDATSSSHNSGYGSASGGSNNRSSGSGNTSGVGGGGGGGGGATGSRGSSTSGVGRNSGSEASGNRGASGSNTNSGNSNRGAGPGSALGGIGSPNGNVGSQSNRGANGTNTRGAGPGSALGGIGSPSSRPTGSGQMGSKGGGASTQAPGAGTGPARASSVSSPTSGLSAFTAGSNLAANRQQALSAVLSDDRKPRAPTAGRGTTVPTYQSPPSASELARQYSQYRSPPGYRPPGSGTLTRYAGERLAPGEMYRDADRSGAALRSVIDNNTLLGRDNRQSVDAIARNMGINNEIGRSALIGTFDHESAGLNTDATGDQGTAYGLAQWRGDRRDALNSYARDMGAPLNDPSLQTSFAITEMANDYPNTLRGLQQASTVEEGVVAMNNYERPRGWKPGGDPTRVAGWDDRVARSKTAQEALNIDAPRPAQISRTPPSGMAFNGMPGQMSTPITRADIPSLFGGPERQAARQPEDKSTFTVIGEGLSSLFAPPTAAETATVDMSRPKPIGGEGIMGGLGMVGINSSTGVMNSYNAEDLSNPMAREAVNEVLYGGGPTRSATPAAGLERNEFDTRRAPATYSGYDNFTAPRVGGMSFTPGLPDAMPTSMPSGTDGPWGGVAPRAPTAGRGTTVPTSFNDKQATDTYGDRVPGGDGITPPGVGGYPGDGGFSLPGQMPYSNIADKGDLIARGALLGNLERNPYDTQRSRPLGGMSFNGMPGQMTVTPSNEQSLYTGREGVVPSNEQSTYTGRQATVPSWSQSTYTGPSQPYGFADGIGPVLASNWARPDLNEIVAKRTLGNRRGFTGAEYGMIGPADDPITSFADAAPSIPGSIDVPYTEPSEEAPQTEGPWTNPQLVDPHAPGVKYPRQAIKVLGNMILPGAGWLADALIGWDMNRINQMTPEQQAEIKARWDRENADYLAGNITRSENRNGYVPPGYYDAYPSAIEAGKGNGAGSGGGTTPPPATDTGTLPPGLRRKRLGMPDPYTYGYGPEHSYFTYV